MEVKRIRNDIWCDEIERIEWEVQIISRQILS